MMKKTPGGRRLIPIKNLILMLVSLVVILATVFAWYTNNDKVTAEQSSISAKSADNIEFALPIREADSGKYYFPISNESWSTQLSFNQSEFFTDLVKDVTSGGKQFAVPNFEAAKGLKEGRKVITDDVWVDGISSKEALTNTQPNDDDQYNYISLDFYVRSKQNDIKVLGSSFLAAGSEVADPPKSLKGVDIYRHSSYGAAENDTNAFSADAIVGAMRVSLVGEQVTSVQSKSNGYFSDSENNETASLRFLWLPRPDIYLQTDNNSDNWRLFTGIKPSGNSEQGDLSGDAIDALANETYVHSFYEGKYIPENDINGVHKGLIEKKYCDSNVKTVSGIDTTKVPGYFFVSKTASGNIPTLGQSAPLFSQAETEQSTTSDITFRKAGNDNRSIDNYYVYKFTLNLWIEGEDAEARRCMNTGIFNLELDFGS